MKKISALAIWNINDFRTAVSMAIPMLKSILNSVRRRRTGGDGKPIAYGAETRPGRRIWHVDKRALTSLPPAAGMSSILLNSEA